MLKEEKQKFEERKNTNYLVGIGASLLNDVVFLGIYFGYLYLLAWYFGRQGWQSAYLWVLYSSPIVAILILGVIRTLPWRKFKRRAVNYYHGISDDIDYLEWYDRLLKRHPKAEVITRDEYVDFLMKPNHQISICNGMHILDHVKSIRKNHLILVYARGGLDEAIFQQDEPRRRIFIYIPSDNFTYRNSRYNIQNTSKKVKNIFYEIFIARYRGFRKPTIGMVPEFFIIWLFQMF